MSSSESFRLDNGVAIMQIETGRIDWESKDSRGYQIEDGLKCQYSDGAEVTALIVRNDTVTVFPAKTDENRKPEGLPANNDKSAMALSSAF